MIAFARPSPFTAARLVLAAVVLTVWFTCARVQAKTPVRAHAAVINGVLATGPGPLAVVASDIGGCSGSVISVNVILTAAHCVRDEDTGELLDPSTFIVQTSAVHIGDPARFFTHVSRIVSYGWQPSIHAGDLALLQLSSPTPAPAMPLATSADGALLTPGTGAVIEGWGVWQMGATDPSYDLRAGGQVVQSAAYCTNKAQQAGESVSTVATMCAIDPAGTYGSCHGDSGGPLVAQRPDRSIAQIGITSFGADDCSTNYPGFYTRVDTYANWIASWVSALAPPPAAPVVTTQPPTPTPTPAPAPTPVAAPTRPTFTPTPTPAKAAATKFSSYTAHGGYLSASVPDDGVHVSWLRIGQQLRCRGRRSTYINDIFTAPTSAGWTMSANKPLKLTLTKPASRRFFRRSDTITLFPGPGGVYGSVRVTMRARAAKLGTCTARVGSFRLRAAKS